MKKVGLILLACLIVLTACKDEAKKKKPVEMAERTSEFLKEDPFINANRSVTVTPDSLIAGATFKIDSTAMIYDVKADGTADTNCRVTYANGKVFTVQHLKDGLLEGRSSSYYPNGQLWSEEMYRHGVQIGEEKCYRENGYLISIGHYDDNGICCGTWKYYKENGEIDHSVNIGKNDIQCGHCLKCVMLKHQQKKRKR